jgi:cytochrome P450
VWLLAKHPDQWDLIRGDPSLISGAINEILRIEAPLQDFSRYVAGDYDLDGVSLPKGSRAPPGIPLVVEPAKYLPL